MTMLPCTEYKKKELQKEALYLDRPHTDVQVNVRGVTRIYFLSLPRGTSAHFICHFLPPDSIIPYPAEIYTRSRPFLRRRARFEPGVQVFFHAHDLTRGRAKWRLIADRQYIDIGRLTYTIAIFDIYITRFVICICQLTIAIFDIPAARFVICICQLQYIVHSHSHAYY
jgi:hypothetical protein